MSISGSELWIRGQGPASLYITALTSAWRQGVGIYDPSLWQYREPWVDTKMMRDADIRSAHEYRTNIVAGSDWTCVPHHKESPRGALAVMVATELLKCIRHFTQARRNLASAYLSGARYAEIRYQPRTLTLGDGRPRTWLVPTYLRDMDKRRFRLRRLDDTPDARLDADERHVDVVWEQWSILGEDWLPLDDHGERRLIRHIYMDDEASLGHGKGLRDALGWWWYAKEHVFAESLDAVERFAQGILIAKVAGLRDGSAANPNKELIRKWQAVLEDMRSRHILVADAEDEVEHVAMNGTGWQLLSEIRKELRETIRSLILGGTLNTGGDDASGGSYARAETHADATEALVRFDREILEETLSDDLIGWLWHVNWRNIVDLGLALEPTPRFSIVQEQQHDPKDRVAVYQGAQAIGLKIAASSVYEDLGIPEPEPGEALLEAPQQPSPFDAMANLGAPNPQPSPQQKPPQQNGANQDRPTPVGQGAEQ